MIITIEQTEKLLEASKPLIKWLNNNCHPHCSAVVERGSVELHESNARMLTEEFIKD